MSFSGSMGAGGEIGGIIQALLNIGTTIFGATQSPPAVRSPQFARQPEPGYEKALRSYTSRLLGQAATSVPPSFLDYVTSGGTARLNLGDTAMTPSEAVGLGIVSRSGDQIPFFDPNTGKTTYSGKQLSPEQILYLGSLAPNAPGRTTKIANEARDIRRLQKLESQPQTARRTKREGKIRGRLGYLGSEV